jgi:glycosyltransferase involved in cell wall biosynthesis
VKIAVLSKSDAAGGGASRVAADLCSGLSERGHDAVHFVAWSSTGFSAQRRPLYGPPLLRKIIGRAHRAVRQAGFPELVPFELVPVIARRLARRYDVVHVHDISSAISPLTVHYLARHAMTFWTLHDCSAFTGGCLYPVGCERYTNRCGSDGGCPRLGEWPIDTRYDHTGLLQDVKAFVHGDERLRTVSPSDWMADQAYGSGKLSRRPTVISNGIDTTEFAPPANRAEARAQLGLPQDRAIVLLSAGWLDDERKGVRPAIAALHAIADVRPFVVLVGTLNDGVREALAGLDYAAPGFLGDAAALARWYGIADVFLSCSIGENQPLVILETMACGVPTVAYAAGGVPEIIADGVSGFLVAVGNAADLERALRRALVPDAAHSLGEAARRRAVERFSRTAFIDRHLDAYEGALAEKRLR